MIEPTVTTKYEIYDYYVTFLVTLDDDQAYADVHNLFKYQSVEIDFYQSFLPPHHGIYKIGPLTKLGVENWQKKMELTKATYSTNIREEKRVY